MSAKGNKMDQENPKVFKLKETFDISIDFEVMFWIVVHFCKNNKEAVEMIVKNIDNKWPYKINCPFPHACSQFPCNTLGCDADVCSNGHAYRMS